MADKRTSDRGQMHGLSWPRPQQGDRCSDLCSHRASALLNNARPMRDFHAFGIMQLNFTNLLSTFASVVFTFIRIIRTPLRAVRAQGHSRHWAGL